ncbi:MAG: 50S ribosomal protein L21 [Anaerolineae bacterium]|jgi:large subunit ribosomal protein L21|uniref:50S ribosomal protein L21 n=1 Tax=Candidatus Amarolinea dominans TaxID=3140696 RepID=UPI001D67673A|nr:50S ribosomal protein L21 [Anaerolineae bacterium]MBK7199952.1 50S ribosomal protein L21 [Anaerolineae bacterium]MBK9092392.1 50S ribosomal protein L21 [Anaerolineae bacterium]MBK9229314.1 50S ribosomal protein L21 [Anaerolineae bacterium]
MFAIVETGGKQYKVKAGDVIEVELLPVAPGDTIELGRVLLVADGDEVKVGTPVVTGASVKATVLQETKGRKEIVFMYRPKKRIRQKTGHRQKYTQLRVDEIVL